MANLLRSSHALTGSACVLLVLTMYRCLTGGQIEIITHPDRTLDAPVVALESENASVHILVAGRVQGVWFRDNTVRQARARGLVGWVKNLRDGRVEIVAQGPISNVRWPLAVTVLVALVHPGAMLVGPEMHCDCDWPVLAGSRAHPVVPPGTRESEGFECRGRVDAGE